MRIIYSPELKEFLKNKHLLLDTNIFRDAAIKPSIFTQFFNELKTNNVTLVTIDFVKYELLKGSSNTTKYTQKEAQIHDIVDAILPIVPQTNTLVYSLIQQYGIDGTAVHITDLYLGAMLIQYKPNLCLMTRDTTDFMQNIFDLPFIINAPHAKGIFTYGIYTYTK